MSCIFAAFHFRIICSLQAIISLPFYCYYVFFSSVATRINSMLTLISLFNLCVKRSKRFEAATKAKLYNLSKIKSTVTHIQYHMLFNCVFMLISHLRVVGVLVSIKIINKHDQNEQTKKKKK